MIMLAKSLVLIAAGTLAVALAATPGSAQSKPQHLNNIVALLDSGKPVFGIFSGEKTPEGAVGASEIPGADFVFYSMESGPFDVPRMQIYMQFLLDRAELVKQDSVFNELPVVLRIPPIRDGHTQAQDRTKQGLDAGVVGIVFPHVETAEEARLAIASMRFRGARDPEGVRPPDIGDAARYWGVDAQAYHQAADLWPLKPDGDLINILLIEDKVGVANAREITSTKGVSVVIPGPGDLRRAYEGDDEAIENAIQTVLAACKASGVVCGITAGPDDIGKRLDEGFRFFIVTGPEAIPVGRRHAGR